MNTGKNFIFITEQVKSYFRFLAENRCPGFECSPESLEIVKNWGKRPAVRPASRKKASSPETPESIRRNIGDCHRCKLSQSRMNIVFGTGNPGARLMFVGEAPGYEEDQSGEPFMGEAGELLTRIIQAMKLTREEVYLCNIIKCRPPGNREPKYTEIARCLPFLERQIRAVAPEFVCALGDFAARALLKTNRPFSAIRGRFHDYMGIKVMPTFHPALLLQEPGKKRETWHDMQQLMKALGIEK